MKYVTRLMLVPVLTMSAWTSVGTQHDSHDTTVTADRVSIGPEYIPRRADLPATLIVAAGRTVELPDNATYDYIEVAGTLRVSRTHDTQLRFTHLINLPGGTIRREVSGAPGRN